MLKFREAFLLCIVCVITYTAGQVDKCISSQGTLTNKEECLNGVYDMLFNDNVFWFGTQWATKCPAGPIQNTPCANNWMPSATNLVTRTVGSYTLIPSQMKYLNVTYTSPAGSYYGCDHNYTTATNVSFILDPITNQTHKPWDARAMPKVTWDAAPGDFYTLIVVDVGYFFIHGVYMNIQGNNMASAEVIKPYHGPRNAQDQPNPYAFLLFQQMGRTELLPAFNASLFSMGQQIFNLSQFRSEHSMTGPVGWNWLLASYDPYSVSVALRSGWGVENCAPFVQEKLRSHNRPFLPASPQLSVFMHVDFEPVSLSFTHCCKLFEYPSRTVVLDPIGDGKIEAAYVRTGLKPRLRLTVNGIPRSRAEAALKGKLHTLLVVDPDIPSASAGTAANPLVHMLVLNMRDGFLTTGDTVLTYRGPAPPDQKPHFYYFLLYQQAGEMNKESYKSYSGQCSGTIANRCQFRVLDFAREQNLTLVGANWLQSENDAYVNYTYAQRGRTGLCQWEPSYTGDCPTGVAQQTVGSSSLFIITATLALLCFETLRRNCCFK